jgi:hypothetical protein
MRPLRVENYGARIGLLVRRIALRQHIRLHIPECRLRLLDDPIGKMIDGVLLEIRLARMIAAVSGTRMPATISVISTGSFLWQDVALA